MNAQPAPAPKAKKATVRRGVVIVAVLLVVTILSLAGYHYADMMQAEAAVAENHHRVLQARSFAESGIWYTVALLGNPNNAALLNGFPYNNNPQLFQGIAVQGDNGLTGRFTIVGPMDPVTNVPTQPTYGVSDETGKINLVAWMNLDPTGQKLYNMLIQLPNMTQQLAYNIIAWMGGIYGINNGGVQDDYYTSLTPPYRCKNNVPDSLDELLLVQYMTRDLLYGADTNRNGYQDGNEQVSTSSTVLPASGFDRGFSAFLTVHGREQNCDQNGAAYMWINNPNLQQLYSAISLDVSDDLAKFIILYQQNGPVKSSGILGSAAALAGSPSTPQGVLSSFNQMDFTTPGTNQITSFFQLVNASVKVTTTDPQTKQSTSTTYPSPLNTVTGQRQYLPLLYQYFTVNANPEIMGRINVNTAPQEILVALENPGSSGSGSTSSTSSSSSGSSGGSTDLADSDVMNIIQMRQQMTGQPGDIYLTPTWLLTEANINPKTLVNLEQYITTRAQVFRVQSVGYFDDGKGPSARIEAVIDLNAGRPRILAWRNLSEFGKGWTDPNSPDAGGSGSGAGSGSNSKTNQ